MSARLPYRRIGVRFMPPEGEVPYFIGSQIRGAMGYALKDTVCVNPSFRCNGCFASENCLYYDWFEKRGAYHLYRLDIELGRPYYDIGLYLFSEAVEKLPYVVSTLHRMLSENGLGLERKKVKDFELDIDGERAYADGEFRLPQNEVRRVDILPGEAPERVKLTFVTPLRLKYRNRFVRTMEEIYLPTLIGSVYRRYATLLGEETGRLPFRVEGEIVRSFGTFEDLTRFSSRQKSKLKIGGMRGEVHIEGLDETSYAYLKAAEIIGMGKQTVFGLGKVKVESL